jgi:hypothetical protein
MNTFPSKLVIKSLFDLFSSERERPLSGRFSTLDPLSDDINEIFILKLKKYFGIKSSKCEKYFEVEFIFTRII